MDYLKQHRKNGYNDFCPDSDVNQSCNERYGDKNLIDREAWYKHYCKGWDNAKSDHESDQEESARLSKIIQPINDLKGKIAELSIDPELLTVLEDIADMLGEIRGVI